MLENLLSAPPPPNVPALKTEAREPGKTLTMRDAMIQHRANPACAGCHSRMDPIGFAMENFDPVGRWRDTDAGSPIDTSGVFPDGSSLWVMHEGFNPAQVLASKGIAAFVLKNRLESSGYRFDVEGLADMARAIRVVHFGTATSRNAHFFLL